MSYRRNQVRCSDRMCGATDCPACYPDSAFGVEICAKCGDCFTPDGDEVLCDICEDHGLCGECGEWFLNKELIDEVLNGEKTKLCAECFTEINEENE